MQTTTNPEMIDREHEAMRCPDCDMRAFHTDECSLADRQAAA